MPVRSHLVQCFSSSFTDKNHLDGMGGGGVEREILTEIQILRLLPDLLNQNLQGGKLGIPVFEQAP